ASAESRGATSSLRTVVRARGFAFAACLTLAQISSALSPKLDARSLLGLARKSTAPSSSARSVTSAPSVVSDDTITTGIGRSRIRFSRKVRPSMRGISTSSVSTSGSSCLIFSRAISGSAAVPTTSMPGSQASMVDINLRTRAESSTTSTRTLSIAHLGHAGPSPKTMARSMPRRRPASEQLDLTLYRIVCQTLEVAALVGHQRHVVAAAQLAHAHPAAQREKLHLARVHVAQVLGHQRQPFGGDVAAHEVDVALAHVAHLRQHAASAEHLHPEVRALPAGLQHRVDQLLHRVAAVARRAPHGGRPAVAGAARLGQHEMVHAANAADGVVHAGRHAGTEHGADQLVLR